MRVPEKEGSKLMKFGAGIIFLKLKIVYLVLPRNASCPNMAACNVSAYFNLNNLLDDRTTGAMDTHGAAQNVALISTG